MENIISIINQEAEQLGADPEMNYFKLLQMTIRIRSKAEGVSSPTPEEFLQYVLQNCTPDDLEQIFNSTRTLVETITDELDYQGNQMTFYKVMEAFKAHQPPSHDPEELPPTLGFPRIILTFELWDIVVHLNNYHMQLPASAIDDFNSRCLLN
jgi:hypothetical protein